MAKHILYNPGVSINGVSLPDHVESVEFTVTTNDAGNAAGMSEVEDYSLPGTRKVSAINMTMFQDFAASQTYATLMSLWTARTTFNLVLKPDSGSPSATNPQFTIPVYIASYPVIAGTRGDRHMSQVVFQPAGLMAIAIT